MILVVTPVALICMPTLMAADKLPNVVIILGDDQSWYDYGFMDHKVIKTPHIDKLADSGILFERGYVPVALCRPSLMTIATGLYPHAHKVAGNDPYPNTDENLMKMIAHVNKFDTVGKLLTKKGYLSHQSGKWWEGNFKAGGFTHGMTRGYPQKGGRHGDDGLTIGRKGLKPVTDFVDMAIAKEKPFFLWYAPFLPHRPHNPPQRLLDKYKDKVDSIHVARYYAMIEWFDETCGELLGYLDNKKVRDNTLVIFLGDNGWIQNREDSSFGFGSKQMPHEGGVRQPTIYSWPNKIKPSVRQDLVNSIDVLPTICGATGINVPEGLPGLNLMDALVSGKSTGRDAIYGESFAHDQIDLDDPEKTLLYRWVIDGNYKLILSYDGLNKKYLGTHDVMDKRPQLYNIGKDPYEKNNLAGTKTKKLAKMVKKLDDWYPVNNTTGLTVYK